MDIARVARHNMIDGQLEPNQVLDVRLIAAMGVTPREAFVGAAYAGAAYVDDNIPLEGGRYLMQPVVLGRLIQAADVQAGDKVLVVGGNTGYSSVVLAQLGCRVVMVEEQRELADRARRIMADMGITTVEIQTSALHSGYAAHAPYDAMLIDGAIEEVPHALADQLVEGGHLVSVRSLACRPGAQAGLGRAVCLTKIDGALCEVALFDASVPVIPSFKKTVGFEF